MRFYGRDHDKCKIEIEGRRERKSERSMWRPDVNTCTDGSFIYPVSVLIPRKALLLYS